jgi:hypothetical protein
MTRARALKSVIRARAAKTGERYTTARRHVLEALQPKSRVSAPPQPSSSAPRAGATSTKGGLSDAKSREKTGHGLDHWFGVLDAFGAVAKGHTASARQLYEEHGVDGWYAQGITVAYERARGVRGMNQRCDGDYEVSVSKVITATTRQLVKAFSDARERKSWTDGLDATLVSSLSAALPVRAAKGFVVRPDGQARFRFKWNDTTVQLNVYPKPGGKVSLVATNLKLSSAAMVEERRAILRVALGAVATLLTSRGK